MRSIYWYENDLDLLRAEAAVMKKFFPQFKLMKLSDGRLYWRGKVNPTKEREWDLMVIYANDHPNTQPNQYGGSIDVFPVSPNLAKLQEQCKTNFPHVYMIGDDHYICTMRDSDFVATERVTFTAATCLSAACKWITVLDLWINGDVGDEVFDHTY